MSDIPSHLRYAKSHEWVRTEEDGTVTIGISDYAQDSLGDITYVQLPAIGTHLDAGAVFGVVESVKAASDLYLPMAGVVEAVNADLEGTPELVNREPYGSGWMIRLKPDSADSGADLLDAAAYEETAAQA